MPASVSPVSSFNPSPPSSRDAGTPTSARPVVGHSVLPAMGSRSGALTERDLMADLEPDWAATIDAATD